jgi:uncharacterized Zn finger protein (UPF0148 family)
MSRPDQILAQHLLNGGKMLAEACPVCYNPLFEYSGQRQCVVCEEKAAQDRAKTPAADSKESDAAASNCENTALNDDVSDAARDALMHILFCITQTKDAHSLAELSAASQMVADIYLKLRQR